MSKRHDCSLTMQDVEGASPSGTRLVVVRMTSAPRRHALLVLPPARLARGLAIELHGSGLDAERQRMMSRLDERLVPNGIALLLPQGAIPFSLLDEEEHALTTGFAWHVPGAPLPGAKHPAKMPPEDDGGWIEAMVAAVQAHLDLVDSPLFLVGYSGGARLASHLLARGVLSCRAAGLVSGLRAASSERPRSLSEVVTVAFHGADDSINPYAGGAGARWDTSVEQAAHRLAIAQGCEPTWTDVAVDGGRRRTYRRRSDARGLEDGLTLYTSFKTGHAWPGSADAAHLALFGSAPAAGTGGFHPSRAGLDASRVLGELFTAMTNEDGSDETRQRAGTAASEPRTAGPPSRRLEPSTTETNTELDMIKVQGPAYVHYRHPSLAEAERFLADFGFVLCGRDEGALYYRGVAADGYCYVATEGDRAFVAGGFEVLDRATLEEASRTIEGASAVLPLPGPQGGDHVQVHDPDGFRIDLVAGRAPLAPLDETATAALNYGVRKQRFGEFQRFERRPARVRKLGHFGFNVSRFDRTFAWYRENLGMVATDTMHDGPDGKDIAAFFRAARGDAWVDHHSVFIIESPTAHVHHCSFEVQDTDEVMMGSEWLKARGWKQFWGVGRHVLGSQIFDYWRDCSGFMIEHYTDGDIVNERHPTSRHDVADESLSVWGPPPPSDFLE